MPTCRAPRLGSRGPALHLHLRRLPHQMPTQAVGHPRMPRPPPRSYPLSTPTARLASPRLAVPAKRCRAVNWQHLVHHSPCSLPCAQWRRASLWLGPVNAGRGRCGVRCGFGGALATGLSVLNSVERRPPAWVAVGAFGDAVWIAGLNTMCGVGWLAMRPFQRFARNRSTCALAEFETRRARVE